MLCCLVYWFVILAIMNYKVSMKCTAIKDIKKSDSFDDAVPRFVDEK